MFGLALMSIDTRITVALGEATELTEIFLGQSSLWTSSLLTSTIPWCRVLIMKECNLVRSLLQDHPFDMAKVQNFSDMLASAPLQIGVKY
jgi:hypothetical protein